MILGIGARGQGRMILSILRAVDLNWTVSGFLDRDPTLHGLLIDGVPVLGGHDLLQQEEYQEAGLFLGIGTNDERKALYDDLGRTRHRFLSAVHPNAALAADVALGDAPVIMAGAIIHAGTRIGTNVIINTGAIIEHDCVVGSHAHVCPGAVLCGGVQVGEGAVVGAGATVKDGVEIGAWATVGCGAVVVKDVPAGLTVVGNPAVPLGTARFREDGFAIIAGLCDPIMLQAIQAAVADLVLTGLSGRAVNYTGGELNSLHSVQEERFTALLQSQKMVSLASTFLGEPAVPRAVELFAKPAKTGLPSPWHQDNAYWCLEPPNGLTIWIALDRCTAENGGLTYLRGSHQLGLLDHQASQAPGSSQMVVSIPPCEAVTPALFPGDALIHHCLTVHGSAANTSGHARRGVTFQYQGVSAKVNESKQRAYEASLEAQVRGRA